MVQNLAHLLSIEALADLFGLFLVHGWCSEL